jgi:hypothetical protein
LLKSIGANDRLGKPYKWPVKEFHAALNNQTATMPLSELACVPVISTGKMRPRKALAASVASSKPSAENGT